MSTANRKSWVQKLTSPITHTSETCELIDEEYSNLQYLKLFFLALTVMLLSIFLVNR